MEGTTEKQADQAARSLKIQPKIRENRWTKTMVPELKLSGLWLAAAGFRANRYVKVEIEDEKIIISLIPA